MSSVPVDPQPHYVSGFPVQVVDFAGRGRGLGAARDLQAGELVLCAERMGHAIRVKSERYFCASCLRHRLPDESPPLETMCSTCQSVWVCEDCNGTEFWDSHAPACNILNFARSSKKLKTEERKLLRYLVSVVAKHHAFTRGGQRCRKCEHMRGKIGATPGSEHVDKCSETAMENGQKSSSAEARTAARSGEESESEPHNCSLEDFLLMQQGPKDKRSMATFQRVAGLFEEQAGAALLGSLEGEAATGAERRELLVQILLRDRVNVFNLADAEGEEAGDMHYPAGAMLNHSCLPNVDAKVVRGELRVFALHAISAGAELYHAYVPLTAAAGRRKAMISEGWFFDCGCLRCSKPGNAAVKRWNEQFLCDCGGANLDLGEDLAASGADRDSHVEGSVSRVDASGSAPRLQSNAGDPLEAAAGESERGRDPAGATSRGAGDRAAAEDSERPAERPRSAKKCTCNAHNLLPSPAHDPALAPGHAPSSTGDSESGGSFSVPRKGSARSRAGQRARSAGVPS